MDNEESGLEQRSTKSDINDGESASFVKPSQLRKEIEKIIGNMNQPAQKPPSHEEEEDSIIEVCLSEVKIKEHKVEKPKKAQKKKTRKVDFSSSTEDKLDSCSDSTKTDVGIPPIPVCDSPKKVELKKKSAVVLDHLSKRKVYVPGREKSEFFRCPHRNIDNVERDMIAPLHSTQIKVSPITMDKQVDRYHYNHFVLRNNEPPSPQNKEDLTVEGNTVSSDRLTLFKRLKVACSKLRNDKSITKDETQIVIEPQENQLVEGEALCYCGTGYEAGDHEKLDEISSGESFDQLYKAKIDSTACPTSFIFRAVDREACKRHGEVHFVVDNRQIPSEPILENLRQSHQQNAMVLSPGRQPSICSITPRQPLDDKDSQSMNKSISTRVSEEKTLQKQYKPVRTRPERIDIYMFDHQDSRYFHTTDNPPPVLTEVAVHKVERVATQFWAEIFSVLHVIFAFVTSFILQTLKFVLLAIVRPLTTGLIQIISDYFLKPLLTIIFNGVVQPPIIFVYNILTSFRDLCRPLASGIGYFIKEASQIVAALRICKILNKTNNGPFVAQPLPRSV